MTNAVLVASAISPLPVDNGHRVFLKGLLKYLVDRFGERNVHCALAIHPDIQLPDLPGRFYRLPLPGAAEKLWNVGARSVLQGKLSLQEALLNSRAMREELAAIAGRCQSDLEFYDTLRMAQNRVAPRPGVRQILHFDDLYSVRYQRMLETEAAAETTIDPLGEFAQNVPGPLRSLARRPAVYRRLLSWEASRLSAREQAAVHQFDLSTLVNSREVGFLKAETGCQAIRVITSLSVMPEKANRKPANPPEYLFLGRLNVPHNDDAICTFITTVLPRLLKLRPDARLTILGGGAGAKLTELAAKYPKNVSVEGFVEDLDPYFVRATAVIAPLRFGSGVKQKVLDALVRGVPVVGTSVALEGIPVSAVDPSTAQAAVGCTVEDDLECWAEPLLRLVDPAVNEAASASATRDASRLYTEEQIYRQYDEIFLPRRAPSNVSRLSDPAMAG